jgi:hypothetical protein
MPGSWDDTPMTDTHNVRWADHSAAQHMSQSQDGVEQW